MIPARSSSAEPEPVFLRRIGPPDRLIEVFRRLFDDGAPARAAKDAVDALAAEGRAMCLVPGDADMAALARDLRALNVEMRRRRSMADPGALIVAIRNRHRLTQSAFADRLGLDVRTLQNWEQGRNRPDAAALSLVLLFDRAPEMVEQVVFESMSLS